MFDIFLWFQKNNSFVCKIILIFIIEMDSRVTVSPLSWVCKKIWLCFISWKSTQTIIIAWTWIALCAHYILIWSNNLFIFISIFRRFMFLSWMSHSYFPFIACFFKFVNIDKITYRYSVGLSYRDEQFLLEQYSELLEYI